MHSKPYPSRPPVRWMESKIARRPPSPLVVLDLRDISGAEFTELGLPNLTEGEGRRPAEQGTVPLNINGKRVEAPVTGEEATADGKEASGWEMRSSRSPGPTSSPEEL